MEKKGFQVNALVTVMSEFLLVHGVYDALIRDRGAQTVNASVVSVVADNSGTEVKVRYESGGKEYTAVLSAKDLNRFKEGQEVEIFLNDSDPQNVRAKEPGYGIYEIGLGLVIAGYYGYTVSRQKRSERNHRGSGKRS